MYNYLCICGNLLRSVRLLSNKCWSFVFRDVFIVIWQQKIDKDCFGQSKWKGFCNPPSCSLLYLMSLYSFSQPCSSAMWAFMQLFFYGFCFEWASFTLWASRVKMTLYRKSSWVPEEQLCLSTCIIKSAIMSEFFQFLGLSHFGVWAKA